MFMRSGSGRVDVLLVDSRAADADITRFAIRRAAPQAKVVWLSSGNLALDYFSMRRMERRGATESSGLVLLSEEIRAPSGSFLLDLLRAHPRTINVPVILMSQGERSVSAVRENPGADDYIARSDDPDEYCLQIAHMIDKWLHRHSFKCCKPCRLVPAAATRV